MYNIYILIGFLAVVAFLLVLYKPAASVTEGFAVSAVDPIRMPACVERSDAAQALLAKVAGFPETDENAAELRLLVSKMCCIEADVSTGTMRTFPLQFRTSHDMEPASTFVGRCLRNVVQARDIDLVIEKFDKRGKELLGELVSGCPEAVQLFEQVVTRTKFAMTSFCHGQQPSMDKPVGVRDVGFWESEKSDLSQYQGISSAPK